MENPGIGTPRFSGEEMASTTRRPYRSPLLIEYGSVSKLTEAAGSKNGDAGQNMMPCL